MTMSFIARLTVWLVADLAAMIGGGVVASLFVPKVNPHNDWGATGMVYALVGALLGNAAIIGILLAKRQAGMNDEPPRQLAP